MCMRKLDYDENDMLEQFRDFNEKQFIDFLWERYSNDVEVLKAFRDKKANKFNEFESLVEEEKGNE